jgi:5-methylcytosine-specific restriction endonuclease McrA
MFVFGSKWSVRLPEIRSIFTPLTPLALSTRRAASAPVMLQNFWEYFEKVIDWAKTLFPNYRKEYHCRDDWGYLYNQYHNNEYDIDELNEKFEFILANSGKDGEIQAKKPVILYLFDGKEKHLSLRAFNDVDKHKKYVEQKGICPICGQHFAEKEMEGDHIVPWSEGGKTVKSNCQMLCKACNRKKGASKY